MLKQSVKSTQMSPNVAAMSAFGSNVEGGRGPSSSHSPMYAQLVNNDGSNTIEYSTSSIRSTNLPDKWGPYVWFMLHNGAASYPETPSRVTQTRMKWFLRGLPVMIPCTTCRDHVTAMVESSNLDNVTSSRVNLAKFFIDMHNFVNQRLNKTTLSYDEVVSRVYPFIATQ